MKYCVYTKWEEEDQPRLYFFDDIMKAKMFYHDCEIEKSGQDKVALLKCEILEGDI